MKIYTVSYGEANEGSLVRGVYYTLKQAMASVTAKHQVTFADESKKYNHPMWFAWLDTRGIDYVMIEKWEVQE